MHGRRPVRGDREDRVAGGAAPWPLRMVKNSSWCEEVLISMWLEALLQAFMDVAQSEQTTRTIRIICTILISLLFLIGTASLFLLVFVVEGQSLLRRVAFLLLGIGIFAYYLQFLKTVVDRGKREKKP